MLEKIIKGVKKGFKGVVLGGTMAASAINVNAQGRVMYSHTDATVMDAKYRQELSGDYSTFFRTRISQKDGETGTFMLTQLNKKLPMGLNGFVQGRVVTPGAADLRAGLDYFSMFGKTLAGGILSTNGDDIEAVGFARYNGKKNALELELVAGYNGKDAFAVERLRAGRKVGPLEIGGALDMSQTKSGYQVKPGFYTRIGLN